MTSNFEKVVELLNLEAQAIRRAADALDPQSVEDAVRVIGECEGKAIVMGVGKSGVIAQKIAQTMTSTGTVAVFVHPSDAMHGSLGAVSHGDVVIALSNSGETDELLAMLPALKRRKTPIVSIVGKPNSTLARASDVVLNAAVDKEAGPLSLAPTTSTTVALAIGDAIAMCLMEERGLTAEDFAANHPAGRLGKRLTVTVEMLMRESPDIRPKTNWLDVVKAISKYSLGAVNVVDAEDNLVGIVTDGDLRRTIERTAPEKFAELTAADMMTRGPVTAERSMLAFDALRLMEDRPSQISVLPVVDADGKCCGLLRLHDLVQIGL